jgi:hypothetical protein
MLNTVFSVVPQDLLEGLLPEGLRPVLANQICSPFTGLFPSSRKYFVRSIAVAPFCAGRPSDRRVEQRRRGSPSLRGGNEDRPAGGVAAHVSGQLDRLAAKQTQEGRRQRPVRRIK